MPFASLGLVPALARTLSACGYVTPTPIQAAALPPALAGRDLLAQAPTGSGKTAAFALPILQGILTRKRIWPRRTQALVLVPTRELAVQVGEVLRELVRGLPEVVRVGVAFGGVSINPQMMDLRGGAEIVVATPGRLLDLVDHNALRLDRVSTLVLDEADRLLDLGFAEELTAVLALLPTQTQTQTQTQRQTLLFSATFAEPVLALAAQLLHEPERIEVEAVAADAPDITQRAIHVDVPRRTQLLRHLVETSGWPQVLVFVATRYATEHVAEKLERVGIAAAALHGDLAQGTRAERLADFKAGRLQVLLATDLAARGLDIDGLPVVVNYDLPRSADDHTHRIGRTGRAGRAGLAVSFISAGAEAHFRLIEKRQGYRVAREQVPGFEPTEVATPAQGVGGVKGARPSKKDKLRAAGLR